MPLDNAQGQALENALNNIRTKVHDDPELLGAVTAFSDSVGESNVTGPIDPSDDVELTSEEAAGGRMPE